MIFFFSKNVEAELEEATPDFNDIVRSGNQLIQKGYGSEEFQNGLTTIHDTRRKCNSDLPELMQELDQLTKDLTEIKKSCDDSDEMLSKIEDEINGLKAIGSDAETINAQMEQVKVGIPSVY